MARLKEQYKDVILPKLKTQLAVSSDLAVPRITKIVINMGCGDAAGDNRKMASALEELTLIAGQKPVITKARKSIAGFKLREGMPVGIKVTLRGERMYEFLDRLVTIAMPRIRDFRGVSVKGFDGRGNYNLGIKEQIVFPEIDYDKVEKVRGMDIAICTTAASDDIAKALLVEFNVPFVN